MKETLLWLVANWQLLAGASGAMLSSLVTLLLLIPGEQGEKKIQKIADIFIKVNKFGVK